MLYLWKPTPERLQLKMARVFLRSARTDRAGNLDASGSGIPEMGDDPLASVGREEAMGGGIVDGSQLAN